MLPYSGSPGRAHLAMHSQATVGARTKDRSVLRKDHTLEKGETYGGLQATWDRASRSQDQCTRDLLVDKGNSAQSTYLLSYVCTITLRGVAWFEIGQEQQPLLSYRGILSSTGRGDLI